MVKLFTKLAVLFIPFFVIISLVNFYVDPAKLFYSGYEGEMAKIMLNGKNVKSTSNYNDRILQIEYIRREKTVPDTVVIGGSKVMTVSDEILQSIFGPGKSINHGMTQAALYDYIGVVNCYKKKGQLPKNILISTDPHILSPIYESDMYKPFEEYKGQESTSQLFRKNIVELFSFSYFQNSINSYLAGERSTGPEATTAVSDPSMAIKLYDGRRAYSKKVLSATVEKSNTKALNSAHDIVKQSGNIRNLDKKKIKDFTGMIDYLQSKGVNIAFYFPPYHPLVYKNIGGTDVREIADKSEKWFVEFAKTRSIKLYGSYDPAFTGCKEADYFDMGHLRSENVAKAFKKR